MTKVLLTGGNGFIGKNLIQTLNKYHSKIEVHAICRKNNFFLHDNLKVHLVDLSNYEVLRDAVKSISPNIVIHLAYSKDRNDNKHIINEDYFNNLKNAFNIIESTRNLKSLKKFIFFGSCDEYGDQKKPYQENQLEKPITSYGLSKLSITKLLKALNYKENYPSIVVRPSVVYGKGQDTQMFLPSLANSLNNCSNFNMTMGEQFRDYIYIDDLIEALVLLINKKDNLEIGEVINITYGQSFPIKEIAASFANMIKKNGEKKLKIGSIKYRDSEVMNYFTSNQKAKNLLGWYPKTSLELGLKKLALSYTE